MNMKKFFIAGLVALMLVAGSLTAFAASQYKTQADANITSETTQYQSDTRFEGRGYRRNRMGDGFGQRNGWGRGQFGMGMGNCMRGRY